ncbi:MAG: glycosyltransferase family 2 protein [Pseudorhodobacter sp.]|nr:glycosyltransferase family 2 protein [Pseudorhodobacter sp.]
MATKKKSAAKLAASPILTKRQSPHGRITAVSMMKDEGPFVLEWIAHHLAVGFTDIVVYTNDCSDGTDDMLIRLEEMGLACHRRNDIPKGLRPQPSALNYAQDEPLVASSDWVMVFDADEFLCIKHGDGTLDDLIGAIKARGANGMVVTWRIFGSGGVHDWSRDPVTEQYLYAAPPMWNKGWGVKTLFQFDPEHWKLGIHRPKIKNKWLETGFPDTVRWLNGSGAPMEDYFKFRGWRSITRTIGYDWAQMNHYAVKSIDSYAIRKFRGNVNFKKDKYNSDYWALQDRNEVRDDAMLRYSDQRQRIFEALLADPELNRLHFAAIERAEARLAEFKGTDPYNEMVAGLKAASLIPIDQVEAKPPQARDPEKIAALMSRVEKTASERQKVARQKEPKGEPTAGGLYVAEVGDMSVEPPLSWHLNHEIALPADPRLFTPPALALIADGKFERNLARSLPRMLPRGTTHAEIGAGCGFLAALLARDRADLQLVVQEENEGLHIALTRLWARNGITVSDRLRLLAVPMAGDAQALAALLAKEPPQTLSLGDPMLGPDTLAAAYIAAGIAPPMLVFLTHRLLAARAGDLPAFAALFASWGLTARLALDATLVLAFARPPDAGPNTVSATPDP